MNQISLVATAFLALGVPAACAQSVGEQVAAVAENGDVILHQSQSSQAAALRAATGSAYTHVGLVFEHEGRLQVLEAVQPVRWTPLDDWIARGADDTVMLMRAPDLTSEEVEGVREAAERYIGMDYDLLFEWSDEQIYCSELVYKAFEAGAGREIGVVERFVDLDLSSDDVQRLIDGRTSDGVDAQEPVVTPVSILRDDDLVLVFENDPELGDE